MPTSYTIDQANRLVLSRAEGTVTDEELLKHIDNLSADPTFDRTFNQVFDTLAVSRVNVSPRAVRLAASHSVFARGSCCAFVTNRPVIIGLVRMFEQLTPHHNQVQIFANCQEAKAWLDGCQTAQKRPAVV